MWKSIDFFYCFDSSDKIFYLKNARNIKRMILFHPSVLIFLRNKGVIKLKIKSSKKVVSKNNYLIIRKYHQYLMVLLI